ncbi:DNA adenine methylase [Bifidobacterium biavatii]|uniref:site-specific DNA-methyltransferase (adenine-specific) n=1 Tax=Bifidobacterium biavatii DSM 23969 TaxID=1437608 RepID=A0A086ZNF8_9BIFI|nr:DNA adenine methylase [Bifidobacterium biavatii]KFI48058.1 DNA methyltransferase [Bifidobacterium biavatii DSM 23969]
MIQGALFDDPRIDVETEGIKYAGSKLKLLPDILALARDTGGSTVWDAFAGTTRVSQAFAKTGYRVVSSDKAVWSKVFATCYLKNDRPPESYRELIDHLNALPPVRGWFTEHYGGDRCFTDGGEKRPWQTKNAMRLDAIRDEIDRLHLTELERCIALTSLILALDKVDNTLGHYVSYLKTWSKRSYNDLRLEIPKVCVQDPARHTVLSGDVFSLVDDVETDIAYFDPPYGSNNEKMPPSRVRYGSYYHIWTTVCLNDRPELFGKANRRKDSSDKVAASVFEEYRKGPDGRYIAVDAIERLIRSVRARWVLLSYSSGGRATADELVDVLSANGRIVTVREIDYKRNVMADMRWTDEWARSLDEPNREFIFVVDKG